MVEQLVSNIDIVRLERIKFIKDVFLCFIEWLNKFFYTLELTVFKIISYRHLVGFDACIIGVDEFVFNHNIKGLRDIKLRPIIKVFDKRVDKAANHSRIEINSVVLFGFRKSDDFFPEGWEF